jgi:NAD(P)-dependent dehydrogenase (short-subunit alcohol dehydrogenase family)
MPDLTGKVALVTGANRGLGFETAKTLAGRGARVILVCRDLALGSEAAARMGGKVEVVVIALDDLASIEAGAAEIARRTDRLDIVVNNAGLFGVDFTKTKQGFEYHFGTNHLGHFALTLKLWPLLAAARVVTVTSAMYRRAKIDFDDLDWQKRPYSKWQAYADSKLANLLFAEELQRRFDAAGFKATSVLAHPGYAATNSPFGGRSMKPNFGEVIMLVLGNLLMAQSPAMGAQPSLMAATDAQARGGDLYGPTKMGGMRGAPAKADKKIAPDPALALRLWQVSSGLTGVSV